MATEVVGQLYRKNGHIVESLQGAALDHSLFLSKHESSFANNMYLIRAMIGYPVSDFYIAPAPLEQYSFITSDELELTVQTLFTSESANDAPPNTVTCRTSLGYADAGAPGTRVSIDKVLRVDPYFDGSHVIKLRPTDLGLPRPTGGSRAANQPMSFCLWFEFDTEIKRPNGPGSYTPVKEVGIGINTFYGFVQDTVDVVRQEYVDYGALTVPGRADFVADASSLNTGNYPVGITQMIGAQVAAVLASFRGSPVITAPVAATDLHLLDQGLLGAPMQFNTEPVFIEATGNVTVSSGYRNPQRNVAVGSKFPVTSKHVWGRAVDIQPVGTTRGLTPSGSSVTLALHGDLYPSLLAASKRVTSASIAEDGATPVPPGTVAEDHVHLQW